MLLDARHVSFGCFYRAGNLTFSRLNETEHLRRGVPSVARYQLTPPEIAVSEPVSEDRLVVSSVDRSSHLEWYPGHIRQDLQKCLVAINEYGNQNVTCNDCCQFFQRIFSRGIDVLHLLCQPALCFAHR